MPLIVGENLRMIKPFAILENAPYRFYASESVNLVNVVVASLNGNN